MLILFTIPIMYGHDSTMKELSKMKKWLNSERTKEVIN